MNHRLRVNVLKISQNQVTRYVTNGFFATFFHYCGLFFCLEILSINSAGISNLFASILGIFSSFVGNRYYVFKRTDTSILTQLKKFLPLYYILSIFQGAILYFWTDIFDYDYNFGFLLCIVFQVFVGYLGGKYIVFKEN